MKKYLYIIILICSWGITGCRKDYIQQETTDAFSQQMILTLNLPVQENPQPKTYAITANDENKIVAVDVLAFKIVNGQELFAYRKQGMVAGSSNIANQAKFYANLPKGDDNYRFVVLCNVREELDNAALLVNQSKTDLLNALIKVQSTKWNAVSSANFTPFPMWGESAVVSGLNAKTNGLSFNMIHCIAAIDVTLSGAAASDFLITSVNLYRSNDRGSIVPLPANYDAAAKSVTLPSLITSSQLPVQIYNLSAPATSFKQEIYLFESKAATVMNNINSTGLVIGGKYKGSTVNSYYRVEMVNSSGTLIPLLRNHRYTVNIVSVAAAGLPTKDQAWTSKNINMSVDISSWNEANLSLVNIAEAYDLAIGQDAFQDNGGRKRLAVNLHTSYSGGWTVTSSANWIVPAAANGPTGNQDLSFNLTGNVTGVVRTGMLTFKAGKLSKTVKVTQAVPNFTDIPGLDFYIAKTDLPGTYNWYLAANVPYGFNSKNDPMQNQVVPARQGSCAQVFGEGWRLPNYNELESIISQKQKVGNINASGFYWTSQYYPLFTAGNYAYIRHGGRGDANGVITSGSQKVSMVNQARCVMSIPL